MLHLSRCTKTYAGAHGIRDVSLRVSAGAVYALCGPNGAGKTTALEVLVGLRTAEAGELEVGAHRLRLDRVLPRPGLGFVADVPVLDDALTGWQWASLLRQLKRAPWPETFAEQSATELGLGDDVLHRPVGSLSFGTRRKVALWSELATTHTVLVLDEPLTGLDPVAIAGLHRVLTRFVADGRSVLLSTHLLREAEAVATHVGLLMGGRMRAEGTLDAVRDGLSLPARFAQVLAEAAHAVAPLP